MGGTQPLVKIACTQYSHHMERRVPFSVLDIEVASSTHVGCDGGDIACSQDEGGTDRRDFGQQIWRLIEAQITSPFPGQHDNTN